MDTKRAFPHQDHSTNVDCMDGLSFLFTLTICVNAVYCVQLCRFDWSTTALTAASMHSSIESCQLGTPGAGAVVESNILSGERRVEILPKGHTSRDLALANDAFMAVELTPKTGERLCAPACVSSHVCDISQLLD